jgi:hypothetical protein
MNKIVYLAVVILAMFACKSKNEKSSTEKYYEHVSVQEASKSIRGNFVQFHRRANVEDYVEVFIMDSVILTYNKDWGFIDTKNFVYEIEGDSLIFTNRGNESGSRAKLETFLPDSFKLDYGYQQIWYYRLSGDMLWCSYLDLKEEGYQQAYEARREKWIEEFVRQ